MKAPGSNAKRQVLLVLLMPFLWVAASVGIAKSSWFISHAAPVWLRAFDREYSIRDRNCDILIFGDSAGITGADPAVISQQLGMSACNVAQTRPIIARLNLDTLEGYLSRNPAPKVLVFVFSANDIKHYVDWDRKTYTEGLLQVARHYPLHTLLRDFATHPTEAFGFCSFIWHEAAMGWFDPQKYALEHQPLADPELHLGHMIFPVPPQQHCKEKTTKFLVPTSYPLDTTYEAYLRQHFANSAGHVLVLAAPVPDCDLQFPWLAYHLDPVVDLPVEQYPIQLFNDTDRHFTVEGSSRYSSEIADTIRARGWATAAAK